MCHTINQDFETCWLINCSFSYCKALEKLNRQLVEAEAAVEASKKPPENTGSKIIGEGLVIDEWVIFYLILSFCLARF